MQNIKTVSIDQFFDIFKDAELINIEAAYNEVGWFRRGIDVIAQASASFPRVVMSGEEPIYNSLDDDMMELDPALDVMSLLDDMVVDLHLYGAFYAVFETNQFGRNGAWRRLHPNTITPDFSPTEGLIGFKRSVSVGRLQHYYHPDELLYIWTPSRTTEIGHGKPLAYPALRSATTLDNIARFQGAFFEHGAMAPTLVTIPGYNMYPEGEKDRTRNFFKRMWSGLSNSHQVHPVDGEVSAVTLQQPLDQMAMDTLSTQRREDVATALGVPQSLLFSQATSFATATQDDINFYDKTVVPLVSMLQDQLNTRLFEPAGYRIKFTKGELEIYQQMEAQKADRLNAMLDRNVITVDEYRAMMGLPEREEEDSVDTEVDPDIQERLERLEIADDDEARDELRTWQRYSAKRFKEGSPEKALEFEAVHVPNTLAENIRATLRVLSDASGVTQVFTDADNWLTYHA